MLDIYNVKVPGSLKLIGYWDCVGLNWWNGRTGNGLLNNGDNGPSPNGFWLTKGGEDIDDDDDDDDDDEDDG